MMWTSGRRYISSLIQKRLGAETPAFLRRPKKLSADLTSRQREVLQLVAEGRVRKEIAQILGVSVKTVEFHKQKITEKLGIHTDAGLTAYAIRHGIASADNHVESRPMDSATLTRSVNITAFRS
jgi:DNA-binding NarL/FixJ family response regulator